MRPTANKPKKVPVRATKPAAKPKKREVDAKMIMETLHALSEAATDVKNRKGFALVSIKNYINNTYGLRMGKERQANVRAVMEDQFVKGHIKMTNHDADKINFTKRFDVASDEEDSEEDEGEVEGEVEADE